MTEIFEQEKIDYQSRMLSCHVEMNGMIAENERCNMKQLFPKYGFDDFIALFKKYGISPNDVPTYRGE